MALALTTFSRGKLNRRGRPSSLSNTSAVSITELIDDSQMGGDRNVAQRTETNSSLSARQVSTIALRRQV